MSIEERIADVLSGRIIYPYEECDVCRLRASDARDIAPVVVAEFNHALIGAWQAGFNEGCRDA